MTDKVLHIGHGFSLPAEQFIETKFGVIGQSGRGKTGLVRRVLEECHRVRLPFVVMDPSGILWGLRSSFDGKGPGLPVLVIGGEHGDVPLQRSAGAEVARAIVAANASCVVDLSQESKATYRQFAKDFAETLFAVNDSPRFLVLDEAPELVPQSLTGRPDLAATFDAVERPVLRGLSLCSGIGGLDLGVRRACPSYRVVCYVEREAYAASLLVARMEDETLDSAPVWDDLATFDGSLWRGAVDIVVAGFPCQPWSVAGSRKGTEDERWLWPEIARIVREVGPDYVFLENVPGLLSGGGAAEVLGSLATLGFDSWWESVRASDAGASHRRERVFILGRRADMGHADDEGRLQAHGLEEVRRREASPRRTKSRLQSGGDVADAGRRRTGVIEPIRLPGSSGPSSAREGSPSLEHPHLPGLQGHRAHGPGAYELPPWPPSPSERGRWSEVLAVRPELAPALEPSVRGVADGLSDRVDRLRALGNAVVPEQAAIAFRLLIGRLSCKARVPTGGKS